MWRRQSATETLKRKENFKLSGIKTRSTKNGKCFTVITELYSKYTDLEILDKLVRKLTQKAKKSPF